MSWVESLESRRLLSSDIAASALTPVAAEVAPPTLFSRSVAAATVGASAVGPFAVDPMATGAAVSGPYSPAQVRHAYGFDQLPDDGTGQTIGIVDAYDDPTIASDLATFDTTFGLPAANFVKAEPQGVPASNPGWAEEMSLDVEWAHAIAPGATIVLVEATSASDTALLKAVDTAVSMGASQVSMSWGGGEFSGQSTYDSHFNVPGVSFLASAGDSGAQVEFPAVSPYVTGVGGTTISLDSAGNKLSETVWSGSGGATSTVTARPSYQAGFQSTSSRDVPDVSYDANPSSGFYVYDNGSWYAVGGTSAGAPQWAGLVALANQARVGAGLATIGTGQAFGLNSVLYNLAGSTSYTNPNGDFFDVTSGSNGNAATVGYDTVTGLGTPVGNKLVPDLATFGAPTTPKAPTVGDSGFESASAGPYGYAYDPSGSAWAFAGNSGVSANGSAFTSGNPNAPQGSQVAFLQTTGGFSQTITGWAAGTYSLSFLAAQRGNNGASNEDFQVLVDGAVVGTFDPTGTSYQSYATGSFTVTAGSHTVTFKGLDTVGGDNTDFIDSVAVSVATTPKAPSVGDSGFESASAGPNGYAYDPSGSAWAFAGNSGVSANNSAFTSGNPGAPQGSQVAFLQTTGGFSQTITGWAAGTYSLSFLAAQRGNNGASNEDFQVLVDGAVVGTFDPTGTSYQSYATGSFTVAAGSHTVSFKGLDTVGGDNSDFIDSVGIATAS